MASTAARGQSPRHLPRHPSVLPGRSLFLLQMQEIAGTRVLELAHVIVAGALLAVWQKHCDNVKRLCTRKKMEGAIGEVNFLFCFKGIFVDMHEMSPGLFVALIQSFYFHSRELFSVNRDVTKLVSILS